MNQIDSGLSKGHKEKELIEAVISTIVPSLPLRSYLNLTYNPAHVQMLFLKSLQTAFQSERITNFMKPHLENLILHLNEAISEEERQAKLAFQKKSKTVVNEVSKANCDKKRVRHTKIQKVHLRAHS